MVTIQKNSPWHDKTEVKRGDYGEELVRRILDRHGFNVFQDVTDKAHGRDFYVEFNKKLIFAADVKTKSMMRKYRETGIDYSKYVEYIEFSAQTCIPFFLFFVDPSKKSIYGNFLHVLDEPRIQAGISYPKTMPAKFHKQGDLIRYYPECAMLPIGTLSDRDVAFLEKFNTSRFGGR